MVGDYEYYSEYPHLSAVMATQAIPEYRHRAFTQMRSTSPPMNRKHKPGQSFTHTFNVPGLYRYVCTLHETSGMKGVIILKGSQVLSASKEGTQE